jgi:hypothetical protein
VFPRSPAGSQPSRVRHVRLEGHRWRRTPEPEATTPTALREPRRRGVYPHPRRGELPAGDDRPPGGSMTDRTRVLLTPIGVPRENHGEQQDKVTAAGGRSSEVEHQLPKLRTRVRFPSPALGVLPGHRPKRLLVLLYSSKASRLTSARRRPCAVAISSRAARVGLTRTVKLGVCDSSPVTEGRPRRRVSARSASAAARLSVSRLPSGSRTSS